MERQMHRERLADHPSMPKVGEHIGGRYEVLKMLGEGGFAVVYHARDAKLSGEVALKVLEPEKSARKAFADRFYQEISLCRQLKHHNTIKIWDAGMTERGCLYMAMELVPGRDLEEIIKRSGGLSPDRVFRITYQILNSLSEAHKMGIIHRDLKPANIRVTKLEGEEDYVKVLDFGIAKALVPDLQSVKTESGMLLCTPNYAAPELLRGMNVVPATDLYALGLMMIESLTGESAIVGFSVAEIITAQMSPEPISIPDEIAGLSLYGVIKGAVQKDVNNRFETADQMREALKAAGSQMFGPLSIPSTPAVGIFQAFAEEITAESDTVRTMMSKVGRKGKGRRIAVLIAAGFLLLGGLGAFLLTRVEDQHINQPNESQPVVEDSEQETNTQEAYEGFQEARQSFDAEDFSLAALQFIRVANQFGDTEIAPSSYYNAAISYEHLEQWEEAIMAYQMLADDYPEHELAEHAHNSIRMLTPFDESLLNEELRGHVADIQNCYERALGLDPSIEGNITLEFRLTSEGTINDLQLPDNDLGDLVGSCVRRNVEAWQLENTPALGSVMVRKTFAFVSTLDSLFDIPIEVDNFEDEYAEVAANADDTASSTPAEEPQETDIAAVYSVALSITSEPSGASVRIDGDLLGFTPYQSELNSTKPEIELTLRADDYHTERIAVDMMQDVAELSVVLAPIEPEQVDEGETEQSVTVSTRDDEEEEPEVDQPDEEETSDDDSTEDDDDEEVDERERQVEETDDDDEEVDEREEEEEVETDNSDSPFGVAQPR